MEANAMEGGEMDDVAGEEVVMEDMDYAKLKNKVIKLKKRVGGRNRTWILIRGGTYGTI
jgi:hypothetical protein